MEIPSTVEIRFEITTKQKGQVLRPFQETPMNTVQGHFYCFQFGPQTFPALLLGIFLILHSFIGFTF